ncbi:peptidoglycan DD-metalloendopeptidase family protein [Enterococcus saccharolyticus]|uniref:Peptidase M23 n=1 Tax=Candidatus Enterococcus willemsii TaxID=1857215 RepID=A0ABQ6YYR5_9ENTE|nr:MULTISPECIES: peptidoglycan DD-metalloendopeptidase family protein [Enterococcus]KAF1303305.1 peptidase M23 [Enterococcus sp. CU12B]MCD5001727.1 peptidoglycan DD-metalloendopeptidase family protein [Enterococcus saccharolyticus]
MIKLKKATSLLLLSAFLASPVMTLADEFDAKIKEQDQKIESLEKQKQSAEANLAKIEARVATVQQEIETVIAEKTAEEKRLNELNAEIEDLKVVIAKRDERLKEQAVNVQTNHGTDNYLETILNAESLSEAFSRTVALTTIVGANNDIIEDQQADQKKLEGLLAESEERLATIEQKSAELADKQQELVETQLEQEVVINELQASVTSEKSQREKFVKQKEEAERKRQEQLKALAEQRAREEAARKKAAEAEAEAIAQANAAQQAQNNAPAPTQSQPEAQTATVAPTVVEAPAQTESASVASEPTSNSSGWASPVSSISVSSPFGPRANPTGPGTEFHNGIDLVGSTGTPIYAAKSGKVVQSGFDPSGGNYVIVDHGDGYFSHYLHLSSIAVSNGQSVSQGTTVGGMGTTGNSTGTHLHFGIGTGVWSGFVDPAPFIGA